MRISGSNTIAAPRDRVWEAINDPAVLARTLPGCEQLEVVETDTYRARVTAGVAAIRGTYDGTVSLADKQPPSGLRLAVQGAGAPGTIGADVDVRLDEVDGATEVTWDADAVVGGMIGGVGQRMLVGVSTRTAGEFFSALERELVEGPPEPAAAEPDVAAMPEPAAAVGAGADAAPAPPGTVFAGRIGRDGATGTVTVDDTTKLVGAFLLGAAVALAGVLIGRRTR